MPRCTREGLSVNPSSKGYQDSEEVFYCETTNEIFRDYEEYFRRIMLINSTIWACEVTGRENLTYAEALKSEKKASEKGKSLREILKAPALLLATIAQQSSPNELSRLLYQFFKEQYLIGEEVILSDCTQRHKYEIIDVIKPKDSNNKQITNSEASLDSSNSIKYKLRRIDKKNNEKITILTTEQFKRSINDYSFDRLNCFLKENTIILDGIICPKENIFKKYVLDHNITFQSIFVCDLPQWKAKKKLSERKEKVEHKEKLKKEKIENKSAEKKKKSPEKEMKDKNKKQQTLSQYLGKSNGGDLDSSENMKNLMLEMDRIRKEREAKQLELEKKKAEMNAKAEEEIIRVLNKCDDLERNDQKPLPQYKPVKSIVSYKYFGDLLMIQEFLHSFSPILSMNDIFPNNVTFNRMCRAFTVREIAGPLSDILQVLLSTIFSLQIDEDDESSIEYREPTNATIEPHLTINRATKTHHFVNKHYSHKIHELPIDSLTLSEVIRLHLLSSGAATTEKCTKWRFMYRNGYSNTEDPGLHLRLKQPHILRALRLYSIYQLPMDDIIKVIKCLMDQILTYQGTISILEDREEKLTQLRQKIKMLYITENKRVLLSTTKKKTLTNEYNLKALEIPDPEEKKKIMNDLNLKIAKIIQDDEKDKKEYEYQLSEARSQIFDHIINLGTDRCYRQYFIFESICGLFIEHPVNTLDDKCLENPPQNCMELANLSHIKQKLKPFFLQRFKEMEKENSKKFTVDTIEANKENSRINGILNKSITLSTAGPMVVPTATTTSTATTTTTTQTAEVAASDVKLVEYGPQPYNPSQYELYMCTGDPHNCIVHNSSDSNRYQWSYIHTEEDLEALIDALNPFGKRESVLKEQLITYKSLILKHITNCPINDLSIGEKITKEKYLSQIKFERRYLNANFGFNLDTDIGDIMYNTLLDKILQFENDISKGHLGKLKVKDIERWRSDLQNNSYDSQCKNLVYGLKNDTVTDFEDPGDYGLGNTTEIKSEDSSDDDDILPLHNSPQQHKLVQNLSSALLQIEQAIEQKFLKEPFGIKNELKDKEANETRLALGKTRLKNWESSLMKSTNFSQIYLHLNVISDAVKWAKSSNHARCIKCRKKSVPEQMLLCDECNAGMHTFCLEPKLTSIPEGNWYCKKCIIKLGLENKIEKTNKKKKVFKMEDEDENSECSGDDNDEEEEEEEETNSEEEEESNNSDADSQKIPAPKRVSGRSVGRSKRNKIISDDETISSEEESDEVVLNGKSKSMDVSEEEEDDEEEEDEEDIECCEECGFNGSDVICNTCNSSYHLECTDLRRIPRGGWECNKCKNKTKTRDRNLKRKVEVAIFNDSSYSEESDEPFTKRGRQQNVIQTRNLRKRNHNDDENKRTNGMNARRSRHIADNTLPLNGVILYDLLEAIMKHEDAWPFLRPVIASQVPDYHDVIKKPMDFGRIKSNLNMGKYRENQDVLNDIELVFRNCDLYNTAGNDVYRAGKSLEYFVYKKCKEMKLPFKPSDMNSNEIGRR